MGKYKSYLDTTVSRFDVLRMALWICRTNKSVENEKAIKKLCARNLRGKIKLPPSAPLTMSERPVFRKTKSSTTFVHRCTVGNNDGTRGNVSVHVLPQDSAGLVWHLE